MFLYLMRPRVPNPYAKKNKSVQEQVTINPVGKIPREIPGSTKGAAAAMAAAATLGVTSVSLNSSLNSPTTNQAPSAAVMLAIIGFCASFAALILMSGTIKDII